MSSLTHNNFKYFPNLRILNQKTFQTVSWRYILNIQQLSLSYLHSQRRIWLSGFSHANTILTKQRNRLNLESHGDLRLKLANFQPNINSLAAAHQTHPSH